MKRKDKKFSWKDNEIRSQCLIKRSRMKINEVQVENLPELRLGILDLIRIIRDY